jgi:isopenicillin N synthase-like dioxygenase
MVAEPIPAVSLGLPEADFTAGFGHSLERFGFAVVADHGLDPKVIETARKAAKALFALPAETKLRYRIAGGAGQRGYTPFAVETAKDHADADLKEFWHVGRETERSRGPLLDNVWPAEIPPFRPAAQALFASFEALGQRLLTAIETHLGLTAPLISNAAAGGNSVLRFLHYPVGDFSGPSLRAAPHEDINAITLLLGAEEAGLEVLSREGEWLAINPPPGAVVVNIGDMLSRLTNEHLPSTTHRVVNPDPDRAGVARYSMPFFMHFRSDFVIETLPECIAPGAPDRYPRPITAAAYLDQRLKELRLT